MLERLRAGGEVGPAQSATITLADRDETDERSPVSPALGDFEIPVGGRARIERDPLVRVQGQRPLDR